MLAHVGGSVAMKPRGLFTGILVGILYLLMLPLLLVSAVGGMLGGGLHSSATSADRALTEHVGDGYTRSKNHVRRISTNIFIAIVVVVVVVSAMIALVILLSLSDWGWDVTQ
jgi:hypothetical protein